MCVTFGLVLLPTKFVTEFTFGTSMLEMLRNVDRELRKEAEGDDSR